MFQNQLRCFRRVFYGNANAVACGFNSVFAERGGFFGRDAVKRYKIACEPVFQLQRCAFSSNAAGIQYYNVICIGGFFHIVSGQKHRKPVFGTKLHNNAPKKEARLRVQSGRGLVKNKNLGFVQKRTRNVNSPPLPAGELDRLLALYRRRDYGAALLLKAAITALTADMAQSGALEEQVIRDYSPAVADTIRYIRRHLSLQLSVRELAGRLYLTPNALGRQFRQETGLTIGRYIDDLLFFSAQAQLIRSDKTIREISDALGFCDPFYFSRRFKQRYGQTPGAYRRLQEANGRLYRQSSDSSAPASAPTQPAAKP